jgi:hypothetical protein
VGQYWTGAKVLAVVIDTDGFLEFLTGYSFEDLQKNVAKCVETALFPNVVCPAQLRPSVARWPKFWPKITKWVDEKSLLD